MSIIDDILSEAVTRLRRSDLITTVVRPSRNGDYEKIHYGVVVTHESPVVNPELSQVGNPPKTAFDMVIVCAGHVRQEYDDGEPIDAQTAELGEEIHDAITNDVNGDPDPTWYSFGGKCINAAIGGAEVLTDGDDATIGVQIPILVTYRVFETKPKQLAG